MQETSLVAVAKKVAMVTIFALLYTGCGLETSFSSCFLRFFYALPLAIYCLFFCGFTFENSIA